MANRTLKFFGRGYGANPASITVVFDGVQVFSGSIPTVNEPLPVPGPSAGVLDELFTVSIPMEFDGEKAVSITVDGESALIGPESINYAIIRNPGYSASEYEIIQNPTSTREQLIALAESHSDTPFTPEELEILLNAPVVGYYSPEARAILKAHGVEFKRSSGVDNFYPTGLQIEESKKGVEINGVAQPDRGPGFTGSWDYALNNGDVMTYGLYIRPGLEN